MLATPLRAVHRAKAEGLVAAPVGAADWRGSPVRLPRR
jgi:hypothetical protein